MIAQLFFQVKHLQKKKTGFGKPCAYTKLGLFVLAHEMQNAECTMQNKKFSFHRCNEPEEPNGVEIFAGLKARVVRGHCPLN